jgi:hypothetical protein
MTAEDLEREAERVAERMRKRGAWVSDDLRIRPEEAAAMLDVVPQTLVNWRYLGRGPVHVKIRKQITYRIVDILAEREFDSFA